MLHSTCCVMQRKIFEFDTRGTSLVSKKLATPLKCESRLRKNGEAGRKLRPFFLCAVILLKNEDKCLRAKRHNSLL